MQNMSFSRSKMNQNVNFECKQFFKFWQDEKFLIQNLTRCIFFQSKIWRVVKLLNQNLMRCIFFILKSDTLYKFLSEICFSKGIFRFSLNYYQTATNITEWLVGKWPLGVKDFFTSVWYVFVSFLLLSFSLLRSLWGLGSWWVWWLYHLRYQLIYTNLFGFQKMVSLQRFYFKRH